MSSFWSDPIFSPISPGNPLTSEGQQQPRPDSDSGSISSVAMGHEFLRGSSSPKLQALFDKSIEFRVDNASPPELLSLTFAEPTDFCSIGSKTTTEASDQTHCSLDPTTHSTSTTHIMQQITGHMSPIEQATQIFVASTSFKREVGSTINPPYESRETPLFLVASDNHLDAVSSLLTPGADESNGKDDEEQNPLYTSVKEEDLEKVIALVESIPNKSARKAYVNTPDKKGQTPLHRAALTGNFEVFSYLVRQGADVSATMNNGNSVMSLLLFKKAKDWKEIQKLILTKAPDALAYADELNARIRIHQLFNHLKEMSISKKKGNIKIVRTTIAVYYNRGADNWEPLASRILSFSQDHPELISQPTAKLLSDTMNRVAHGNEASAAELYFLWWSGQPVILNSGSDLNFIPILIWDQWLVCCDSKEGFKFDRFEKQVMSLEIFQDLTKGPKCHKSFYNEVKAKLKGLMLPKAPYQKLLESSFQNNEVRHPAWQNAVGAIKAFLIISGIEGAPTNTHKSISKLNEIASTSGSTVKLWLNAYQRQCLTEYVSKLPSSLYKPDETIMKLAKSRR